MGGALHPGVARAGASFELSRLELEDGQLVVGGWWFGVRGIRFVRPALIVDGRQVLATLEHKPWAIADDGSWTAAFPWQRAAPDASRMTLVVAPSVEVPLDRETAGTLAVAVAAGAPEPEVEPDRAPAGDVVTRIEELREPLREELGALELRLDAVREELHEARTLAAERESRCRELEHVVAAERRAADAAGEAGEDIVRAHAMAVLDRDRALAQLGEAVGDREAAVRARRRMEVQHDAAVTESEAARRGAVEALAEREEVRRQRDEVVMAHESLRAQLTHEWGQSERALEQAAPAAAAAEDPPRSGLASGDEPTRPLPAARADRSPRHVADGAGSGARRSDAPSGVRVIPAARALAGDLHRARREREGAITRWDMWAIRIFGSVAALTFITLLVMILKAFFVF